MNYKYKGYTVFYKLSGMDGCCGICTVHSFSVRDEDYENISKEEYDKLDHIDFIKVFEQQVLDSVEKFKFSRVYISDVLPDKIENEQAAYFSSRATHNDAINLYTILTDLEWKKSGDELYNNKTDNTVQVFYKDV